MVKRMSLNVNVEVTSVYGLFNLLWGQGKKNFAWIRDYVARSEDITFDTVENFLEENFDGASITAINDTFWFSYEAVLKYLGLHEDVNGNIARGAVEEDR